MESKGHDDKKMRRILHEMAILCKKIYVTVYAVLGVLPYVEKM